MSLQIPEPPSLHAVRQRIDELKRINLLTADIDQLKSRLKLFFRGYRLSTPILSVGQVLYRGVRWEIKPANARQLSYPPPNEVTTLQRVNRTYNPTFYSCIAREAPFFELGLKSGDHLAISKWRITKKILVNNVGYANEVFENLKSNRGVPSWGPHHPSAVNQLIARFLATEFSKIVPIGHEHEYKMSVAIAEKLYGGDVNVNTLGDIYDGEGRFGGLMYPTIAMRANADNIALLPKFVDQYLELESVEWIRVDSEGPDFKYQVTNLDFANTFKSTGDIEWKGRLPHWDIRPGQQVTVSVENGKYVVRSDDGKVLEPT